MHIHDAISARMMQLAEERNKTVAEVAKAGGLRQSTVSEIIQGRSQHPRVNTIQMYCKGAGITMAEFFDNEIFNVDEVEVSEEKKN